MKKLVTLVIGLLLVGTTGSQAASHVSEEAGTYRIDGSRYIFIEGSVEFSVFPDGQFDFVYIGPQSGANVNVNINTPNVNISYNSGYDYETYVQYDDYGAVIQVEEVPIYYDAFGRIIQAGNTEIHYNDRRIVRVGGLRVFYNNYGHFTHYTGFINVWTPRYIFRPWHVYYVRPVFASCVVYDFPYRTYYNPYRYSWAQHRNFYTNRHRVAYANGRRNFYRPGSRVHYKDGRVAVNRNYNPNRRNTAVAYNEGRRSNTIGRNSSRNSETTGRANRNTSRATTTTRGTVRKETPTVDRGSRVATRTTALKTERVDRRSGNRTIGTTQSKRKYGTQRNDRSSNRAHRGEQAVASGQRGNKGRSIENKHSTKRVTPQVASNRTRSVQRSAPQSNKRKATVRTAQNKRASSMNVERGKRSQSNARRGRGN
jgi:hypothetical protein